MSSLMKTLTIGSGTYEICDASAREDLENKVSCNIQSLTVNQQAQARSNIGAAALTDVDKMLPKSGGTMTGSINMNGQSISGLNSPADANQAANKGYVDAAKTAANTYTDISVRKAAPRNLLDNSDFTNLIAQADIGGSHGAQNYAADRWILDSGTVSYEAGVGLTLNGTIRQKLEFPPTGETSAFVGTASGAASISYTNGAVKITSSGGVLKWAALYSGGYTDATKPEYQPKGYGAELAECQRYYRIFKSKYASMTLPGHVTGNSADIQVYPPNPIKMRIPNPTVIFSGAITIRGVSGYATNGNSYSGATVEVYGGDATYFSMLHFKRADHSSWGLTNNTPVAVNLLGNSVLEFSADL